MRIGVAIAALLATAGGAWSIVSSAPAARRDGSTLMFLKAERTLFKKYLSHLPAATSAAEDYVKQAITECPDVAAHAPAIDNDSAFFEESGDAVAIAFDGVYASSARAYALQVQHLSWSNRELTRLVHADAAAHGAAPTPPHLCSDLREWVASGYGPPPQSTRRFLRTEEAASHGGDREDEPRTAGIDRLLTPYATGAAKGLLHSDKQLEARVLPTVLRADGKQFSALLKGLGIAPPAISSTSG